MAANRDGIRLKTRRAALDGMLFALAIVLSILEGMIPVPVPVPGVKLGLSNIVVMYALFFLGKRDAFALAILKGMFAFVTRGWIAGLLSVSGGILSVAIMALLQLIFKANVSYFLLSIAGAIFHNGGQLVVVKFIYPMMGVAPLTPILVLSGIAAGVVTSATLRGFMPLIKRYSLKN